MIILGFTGTRAGMTPEQLTRVIVYVKELKPDLAVIGGCDGADDDFQDVCEQLGVPYEIRPSFVQIGQRKTWPRAAKVHPAPAGSPLIRNRQIVEQATHMIATPKENFSILRSGTWATIRYTVAAKKPLRVFYPKGQLP